MTDYTDEKDSLVINFIILRIFLNHALKTVFVTFVGKSMMII